MENKSLEEGAFVHMLICTIVPTDLLYSVCTLYDAYDACVMVAHVKVLVLYHGTIVIRVSVRIVFRI